jgi:hypothetical protein
MMAGHLLFECAGRKERFDGDLADGEVAIHAIGSLKGTTGNQLTLFKRL